MGKMLVLTFSDSEEQVLKSYKNFIQFGENSKFIICL